MSETDRFHNGPCVDGPVEHDVKLGEYRWERDDYGRGPGGSWRWHPENPS